MKLTVEVNNLSQSPVKNSFFKKIAGGVLSSRDFKFLHKKNISVSVALVNGKEIKKLNRIYRRQNSVTDVLSFSEYQSQRELMETGDKDVFLGEVILCYNYIKERASKGGNIKKELARATSHGLLHLLGFRHGKKMFKIQDNTAEKLIYE